MKHAAADRVRIADKVRVPSQRKIKLFAIYVRWYLRRHFHAVRVANLSRLPRHEHPLILFTNHASWWDPLAGLVLAQSALFERQHYAPMDEAALQHYSLFRSMGFFPVENGSPRGVSQLLRAGVEILNRNRSVLWITPESRLQDVRTRPIAFRPGLGALINRVGRVTCVPVAMEYVFWSERLPEILINIGEPFSIADGSAEEPGKWTSLLSNIMTTTLDELAALSLQRTPKAFDTLLSGASGIGGIYEFWKRFTCMISARPYYADHDRIK
jgi:1-acyl-sn-glycerol-3-phosphate acyltransferase